MSLERDILDLEERGIGVPAAVRVKGLGTLENWVREQLENVASDLLSGGDSPEEKAQRALTEGEAAPGPYDVAQLAAAIAIAGTESAEVVELRRLVTVKDWLQGVGIDTDDGALATAAVFLAHGGKDGKQGSTEFAVDRGVAAVLAVAQDTDAELEVIDTPADAEPGPVRPIPSTPPDPEKEAATVAALEERAAADEIERAKPDYEETDHSPEPPVDLEQLAQTVEQLSQTVETIAVGVAMLLETSGLTIPDPPEPA